MSIRLTRPQADCRRTACRPASCSCCHLGLPEPGRAVIGDAPERSAAWRCNSGRPRSVNPQRALARADGALCPIADIVATGVPWMVGWRTGFQRWRLLLLGAIGGLFYVLAVFQLIVSFQRIVPVLITMATAVVIMGMRRTIRNRS